MVFSFINTQVMETSQAESCAWHGHQRPSCEGHIYKVSLKTGAILVTLPTIKNLSVMNHRQLERDH